MELVEKAWTILQSPDPAHTPTARREELLNQPIGPEFIENAQAYYAALAAADKGELKPLRTESKLPFSEP